MKTKRAEITYYTVWICRKTGNFKLVSCQTRQAEKAMEAINCVFGANAENNNNNQTEHSIQLHFEWSSQVHEYKFQKNNTLVSWYFYGCSCCRCIFPMLIGCVKRKDKGSCTNWIYVSLTLWWMFLKKVNRLHGLAGFGKSWVKLNCMAVAKMMNIKSFLDRGYLCSTRQEWLRKNHLWNFR